MTGLHTEKQSDPLCPGCGHRHQFQGVNAAPCWVSDPSKEMCKHAPKCIFCDNGIHEKDGHIHLIDDKYIHAACIRYVIPSERVPDPAKN